MSKCGKQKLKTEQTTSWVYKQGLQERFTPYKLQHVCLSITFIEEATQKWPVKSTACASNKNKIFHRKAFCAALRLLSHPFNLYDDKTSMSPKFASCETRKPN